MPPKKSTTNPEVKGSGFTIYGNYGEEELTSSQNTLPSSQGKNESQPSAQPTKRSSPSPSRWSLRGSKNEAKTKPSAPESTSDAYPAQTRGQNTSRNLPSNIPVLEQQQDTQYEIRTEDPLPHQDSEYDVKNMSCLPEDIIFCIDVDEELDSEIRPSAGKPPLANSGIRRIQAVKQSLLLFFHAKGQMDPRHKFGIILLLDTPEWEIQPTNDTTIFTNGVANLCSKGSFSSFDVSHLFQMMCAESKESNLQNRLLRMILIYNRSTVIPTFSKACAELKSKCFTCDVLYLHERPSEANRPQEVYDVLIQTAEFVSLHPSFSFAVSSNSLKVLYRNFCSLLANPLQRCDQSFFIVPRDISPVAIKAAASAPAATYSSAVTNSSPPNRRTRAANPRDLPASHASNPYPFEDPNFQK